MVYPFTRYFLFPLFRKLTTRVVGLENLPAKAPFIVAANHITQIDALPIIGHLFPKYQTKINFIVRPIRFRSWYRHLATTWAGCIVIDKDDPSAVIEAAVEQLNSGNIVGIFPEGRRDSRANSTKLYKGKTGVARLAHRTGLPVIPMGIFAHPEALRINEHGDTYSLITDTLKPLLTKQQRFQIILGKPMCFATIPKEELNYTTLRNTTDTIMQHISTLCNRSYSF